MREQEQNIDVPENMFSCSFIPGSNSEQIFFKRDNRTNKCEHSSGIPGVRVWRPLIPFNEALTFDEAKNECKQIDSYLCEFIIPNQRKLKVGSEY